MTVAAPIPQSQLFGSSPTEKQAADMEQLFALPAEARYWLMEALPPQVDETSEALVPTAGAALVNEDPARVEGAWRALLSFQAQLQRRDNRDDIQAWQRALQPVLESRGISEEEFSDTLQTLMGTLLRAAYARGILPSLNNFGATVELRAVQGATYQPSEDIEQYTPQVLDFVPIASLAIGVDTGRDFRFQADLRQLKMLVDQLRATLKDGEKLAEIAQRLRSGLAEDRG